MGDHLSVSLPGRGAGCARRQTRASVPARRDHSYVFTGQDRVALDRFQHALSLFGDNHRIERLVSAVARGTYGVPAHEISRSLLAESLDSWDL